MDEPRPGDPASAARQIGDVRVVVGDDAVATVELCRPPSNYFDVELIRSIADAYAELDADPACRAIVLCAQGRHFCAGARFSSSQGDPATPWDPSDLYAEAARLLEASTPVVAAVQGAAVGGGLGLACTADFRVCTPATTFRANFARLGIHHGFGLTATLPSIVGEQRARLLLLTGRAVPGDAAVELGLADVVVPDDALGEAAHRLAAEVASAAPLAVTSIKRTLDEGGAGRFRAATARELAAQVTHFATSDFAEGVRAAAERRAPVFEGR